ncbi:NAD(P)H-hydrate epimerase, partial [Tabrizicola sp.]|uniref:NAD(P)H-hydrate epimerase n=1 Tax=Tabrizicola sp. TaxID=2005166 RepID=UPI0035AE8213
MTELLTAAQMRAVEAAAIAGGEVTGLELMERAGRGVVEAVFEEWPELAATSQRAVVLCGPGNNGGDGFVVARLLKEWGWEVEVFLYGDPERLPPDARVNHERWRGMGEAGPIAELNTEADGRPPVAADVLIDALFGTGLTRALTGAARDAIYHTFMGYIPARLVAVDVPSGLCADSGRPLVPDLPDASGRPALDGRVAEAMLTVTFHRLKLGHVLADGPRHCGKVVVKDIGLRKATGSTFVTSVAREQWRRDKLGKRSVDHKYSHGHALILSGPSGRGGAARLAARGALRIGAGLVTLGCPPEAIPENAARLDAVMLREVADGAALAGVLEDGRINALCLGPGMGTGEREARLMGVALGGRGGAPPTG